MRDQDREQDQDDKKRDAKDSVDDSNDTWRKRDSRFNEFDDDSDFEESDRDSDFNAIYTEVDAEEEDLESEDPEDWSVAEDEGPSRDAGDEPEDSRWDDNAADDEQTDSDLWDMEVNPEGSFDDDPPEEDFVPAMVATASYTAAKAPSREWQELDEEDDYDEDNYEDSYDEEEERELNISLGMIVVAVFALILLAAGGYGIVEERASLQGEIRQLQASLATSASPEEVTESREATARASERNALLQEEVADMGRENRSLQAIISGLESQLTAQREALAQASTAAAPAPAPAPAVKPTPKEKPVEKTVVAPAKPAPATKEVSASGDWFVNFSSYGQRSTAQSWAGRLKPDKGRVLVAAAQSNGKTVYRVRVVDLPGKASAQAVAEQLQRDFKTGALWVGRTP